MAERVRFTEEMKGFVGFGGRDYADGFRLGQQRRTPFMFHLTITSDDVEAFLADPACEAEARGWIGCPALGGDRLPVDDGRFNLFAAARRPDRRVMRYRLPFLDGEGRPVTMFGFKDIGDDPGLDVWSDTTYLHTRVLAGHVPPGEEAGAQVLGLGVLRILVPDFARQLTTFRGTPRGVASFGRAFVGTLWEVYRRGGVG